MSLKPGIGLGAMDDVASVLLQHVDDPDAPVPTALRHGKRLLPLGRYLRDGLRLRLGHEKGANAREKAEATERVREVREAAFEASESFSEALARSTLGARQSVEVRQTIFKGRKKL